MFARDKDGDFIPVNTNDPDNIMRALPSGAYAANVGMSFFLKPFAVQDQPFVSLDTPTARKIVREVDEFFNAQMTARLAQAGLKHRRGIIVHGPPGTGKTSLIRSLFPYFIQHGAVVVVDCNADHLENLIIPAIRRNDPERPIVLFFDEFDKNARYSCNELLRLLDGLNSPDHLLTIGCTNHLNAIPIQMRARPSRFSLVLELASLPSEARATYVATKYPMLDCEMRAFVLQVTDTRSLDYLEEACKLALMGYEPDELRDRIAGASDEALAAVEVKTDDDE